jgi:type IV secretory pathway TraG/TraD family ATPase VirD4
MSSDLNLAVAVAFLFVAALMQDFKLELSTFELTAFAALAGSSAVIGLVALWIHRSATGRERKKIRIRAKEIPLQLKDPTSGTILGKDRELGLLISFPNRIRLRHTHILGATGAGKTEGVVLNLLGQDIKAGSGAIILDGKGDDSFLSYLKTRVPKERLRVFDLGDSDGDSYNPLVDGTPAEAAQRLFASLNWSEEYYKSKASAALQRIFHSVASSGRNPTLAEVADILSSGAKFRDAVVVVEGYSAKAADNDYQELSGLKDQVALLCSGHLKAKFSAMDSAAVDLRAAANGMVVYFRLQSLLSRQLAGCLGRLIINHLSFLAGSAHREGSRETNFVPVYLDEFATFACPEFADLIAKARSAGFALHFSHQSIGDLEGVQDGFLSQIMDNSATKIIMRVNDPDTAETFSRAFGTRKAERITKRVSNATDLDLAESDGFGSLREVREFRASPDLLKSLPTGVGAVLIAHGEDTPHGASSVFQIQFPKLT